MPIQPYDSHKGSRHEGILPILFSTGQLNKTNQNLIEVINIAEGARKP